MTRRTTPLGPLDGVYLADPITGEPASGGGGGGGGGDTSNIKTTGTTVPSTAALAGGTDGTNIRAVSVDAAGRLTLVPSGGVSTTESNLTLNANNSTTVVASNTNRLFLTIDNPNATDIWINTQGAAVATPGSSMRIFGNTQVCYSVQEIGTNAITAISTVTVSIRFRQTTKA